MLEHQTSQLFTLSSREDFQAFDERLAQYMHAQLGSSLFDDLLGSAFLKLHSKTHHQKMMASLLDLKLVFTFLCIDFHRSSGNYNAINKRLRNGGFLAGSILNDQELFNLKLQQLFRQHSFVLRARSFWDKFMGFLFLYEGPDEYDKFARSKSRKSYFKKHAASLADIPRPVQHSILSDFQHREDFSVLVDRFYKGSDFGDVFIAYVFDITTDLDDSWRTHEAHGTGALRKHTLSLLSHFNSKDKELISHYNAILHVTGGLTSWLSDTPQHDFREDVRYMKSKEFIDNANRE